TVLNALYRALGPLENSVQVRLAAIQSLTMLGGPVDNNLRAGLFKALDQVAYSKDSEPVVKIWAHMAVMSITRSVGKERVDAIASLGTDKELAVRIQAIQGLGVIGKDAKQSVPQLMKALRDPEPNVVALALWSLGRMGAAAAGAVPTLEQLRTDMTRLEVV